MTEKVFPPSTKLFDTNGSERYAISLIRKSGIRSVHYATFSHGGIVPF